MRRSVGLAVVAVIALLAGSGCSALGPPELTTAQRSWCLDHQLPDPDGGPSVAAAARRLGIASPDVETTLAALDATYAEGSRLAEDAVRALASGDQAAIDETREAYLAWERDVAFPAQQAAAEAVGGWSTTPEWAEACDAAFAERGAAPTIGPSGGPGEPTGEPTAPATAPATAPPAATAAPTPRLTVKDTLTYTSRTSVGRLIELKLTVRNPGELKAGKVSVQVEGLGYAIADRTPIVGCIPDCRTATGAEGIVYVEWGAPAPGASRAYTVQLKAKRAGTYRLEVQAYRGPAVDPIDQIGQWTVKTVVR
jgi:hypothetical protein